MELFFFAFCLLYILFTVHTNNAYLPCCYGSRNKSAIAVTLRLFNLPNNPVPIPILILYLSIIYIYLNGVVLFCFCCLGCSIYIQHTSYIYICDHMCIMPYYYCE